MSEERTEWLGKTFKSGNSAALRLPKDMGLPEGTEVRMVREAPMTYRIEPVAASRKKLDVDSIWGVCDALHVPAPREDFDERPSVIAAQRRS